MKAYLGRETINTVNAILASTFDGNLKRGEANFNSFMMRIIMRIDTTAKLHDQTKHKMFNLGLDFDSEFMEIPDIPTGYRTVSFSHTQLIVMNTLTEISSYGFYDKISICLTDPMNAMCQRIKMLNDFLTNIILNAMRIRQDNVNVIMENELHNLAVNGENTQYIIIGICIGLVIVFLIAMIPVFTWVIRNKSYVLSIFSDIEIEEIQEVIDGCKILDIKKIKYRKKWITKFEAKPSQFWNKLITKFNPKSPTNKKSSQNLDSKFKQGLPNSPRALQNKNEENYPKKLPISDQKIDEAVNENNKKLERRKLLSEIEYFSASLHLKIVLV